METTARFNVDISDLRQGINEANNVIRRATAEFNNATAGMDRWSESADGLTARIRQQETVVQQEQQKLQLLRQQLERLNQAQANGQQELARLNAEYTEAVRVHGAASAEAQEYARQITATETALQRNRQAIEELNVRILNQDTAVQRAQQSVNHYQNSLRELTQSQTQSQTALGRLTNEISQQESQLETLRREYQNTVLEQGESSQAAQQLGQRISELSNNLNENRTRLQNAQDASHQFDNSLEQVETETENVSGGFTVLKGVLANLISEGINKAVDAFKDLMVSSDKALNSLQAKTGMTSEEMAKFKGELEDLYKQNYGESMEDLADAMATVAQSSKDVDPSQIKELTKDAIILRDTFGFEVNESMRAANMLMDQFGVTGKEAFNLIAQGAQNGLNKNDDLLDSINEYGVHYKQMGYSAEEFFNSLKNGTDAGTFSVDKLGDAMKEFGIRTKDNSESTIDAFKSLGIVSDLATESIGTHREALAELEPELEKLETELRYAEMAQAGFNEKTNELTRTKSAEKIASLKEEIAAVKDKIDFNKVAIDEWGNSNYNTMKSASDLAAMFSAGGKEAQDATNEVLTALFNMDDAVKQNEIGVALFGTMWEDLGVEGVKALVNVNGEADKTAETMQAINDVKYNDIGSALSEVGRTLETDLLLPIVNEVMPTVKEFLGWLKNEAIPWIVEHGTEIKAVVVGIGAAFAAFKVVTIIQGIITALTTLIPIIKSVGVAQAALNVIMSANPVGLIVAAIAGLVAAFITLWNKCDAFREFWINLWEKIKAVFSAYVEAWSIGFNMIIEFLKSAKEKIVDGFNKLITNVSEFVESVVDWFKNLGENIAKTVKAIFDKIVQWGKDLWHFATYDIPKFISKVIDFFASLPGKLWEQLKNAAQKVFDWGVQIVKTGTEKAGEFLTKVLEFYITLPGKIWDFLKQAIQKISDWGDETSNTGIGKVAQFIAKVLEFYTSLPGRIWEFLTSAIQKVADWGSETIKTGSEKISEFVTTVVNFVKELPTKIYNGIKGAVDKVSSWGSDLVNKGKAAATNLVNNIVDTITGLPGKMGEIGSNLVEGLWNGINDMTGWITGKLESFGDSVLGGIKDFFGIHSPSRVMEKLIGNNIVYGLVNGITNKTKDAVNAMTDLGDAVIAPINGLQPSISGISHKVSAGSMPSNNSKVINYNFVQNNTSPKPLNQLEIYRQTKNQLSLAKHRGG